jgi:hypothetical protein
MAIALGLGLSTKNDLNAQFFEKLTNNGVRFGASFGAQLYLGQRESNFSIRIGGGIWKHVGAVQFNNQLTLNYYLGGMGNSQLANSKLPFTRFPNSNLDFVISPSITLGLGQLHQLTHIRPFNYMSVLNITHNYAGSLTMITNFVLNNHHRNQRVGAINFNIGSVSGGYYNDVMRMIFEYEGMGMADDHDRYWTGGGFLNIRVNQIEFFYDFDRFTGFGGKLFEISKLLGLNQVYYRYNKDLIEDKSKDPNYVLSENELFYNRGKISFGLRFYGTELNQISFLSYTMIGNPKWDIQNIIHKSRLNPFHPSYSIEMSQAGIGYSGLINN